MTYYQPDQYKGITRAWAVFAIGFTNWIRFLNPQPGYFVGRRDFWQQLSPMVSTNNQGQSWLGVNQEDGRSHGCFECQDMGSFRKPGAGMLQWLMIGDGYDEVLMIGDRPEDKSAAEAAGVEFLDADLWRLG